MIKTRSWIRPPASQSNLILQFIIDYFYERVFMAYSYLSMMAIYVTFVFSFMLKKNFRFLKLEA